MLIAFIIWWHPLIGSVPPLPYLDTSRGRLVYLIAGIAPAMLLGVLILFWPDVLYTYYLSVSRTGDIPIMLDQQLGGMVMLFSGMVVLASVGLPLQYFDVRPLSRE